MNFTLVKTVILGAKHLRDFTYVEKAELMLASTPRYYASGATIYTNGQASDGTFFLAIDGRLRVQTEHDAPWSRIDHPEGTFFGELAFINPSSIRTASLVADSDFNCLQWNIEELRTNHPTLFARLTRKFEEIGFDHLTRIGSQSSGSVQKL